MTKPKINYQILLKNIMNSYLWGGIICLLGEIIRQILINYTSLDELKCNTIMLGIMILLASLLSAFGIYDKIGQKARSGSVIPITGFANSMISSAMEYKPEGFILGIGASTFKLAGSVITLGIFSAFIVSFIRYLIMIL